MSPSKCSRTHGTQRKLVVDRLIRFARIDRVEKVLQPYLEAVVA